ncbi:hypothetical protein BCR33DRAFT_712283 [Rhizoclosmatium globosum]|uniref:C2H2-type domain-containing protein n=1 Tax=Rhizoclosmatium globosum TaxID=329046 RepID=A0A1Y2CYJ3_9FUNG|nr:hypothetical protein BCR33DRAFT_712283 [Rhizoclosmatium globosum]|eukprot:ORY52078.1 hypothetical protein BCR33DRAFT_712283 [Rhizoclosmatium globosum]
MKPQSTTIPAPPGSTATGATLSPSAAYLTTSPGRRGGNGGGGGGKDLRGNSATAPSATTATAASGPNSTTPPVGPGLAFRGAAFAHHGPSSSPNPFLSPRLRAAHSRSRGTSLVGSFGNHAGSIDRDSMLALALHTRSPLLASSPSRDLEHFAGLTDEFCKDFVCCGINMDNLHDLLQHFEEYHVSINDDNDSDSDMDDTHSDPAAANGGESRMQPATIWNSYGRNRTFGSTGFDDKDGEGAGRGASEEFGSNSHLPFAFEVHDDDMIASENTNNIFSSAVPPTLPTPISQSTVGSPSKSGSSASAALSFASRSRAFQASTNLGSNSIGFQANGSSNFTSNILSTSLGALSVTGYTGPTSNSAETSQSGSVKGSGGSIATMPSPSSSTHSTTPPPLHHELLACDLDNVMEIVASDGRNAQMDEDVLSAFVKDEPEVSDSRRRGSQGQILMKRKAEDDRMELDQGTPVSAAAGVTGPVRLDSISSNISDAESISNKKRATMDGNVLPVGSDASTDAQFIVDQDPDQQTALSNLASTNWASGLVEGVVRSGLSHFRKRSLLSSASFSPTSAPEMAEQIQQQQQQHIRFSEMSAEAIEEFQQMSPEDQQAFILSNLEPQQIELLMMMVNQASLEATASLETPGASTPATATIAESSTSSTPATPAPASTSAEKSDLKAKSSITAAKLVKGKPKATQKISLRQQQKEQLKQEGKKAVGESSSNDTPTSTEEQQEEDADRPFKCHLCEKTYKNPGGIKYHLKHTHGIEHISFADMSDANRPYLCSVEGCGKRYKNLNGLKYHIEHAHYALLEGSSTDTKEEKVSKKKKEKEASA